MTDVSLRLRHVVAWLQPVRWTMCVVLWAVFGVVWLFPHLDLPLRTISTLGLAAAICRTLVALLHARPAGPSALFGIALAADAAHELSTPLATIAVAARELERNAGRVLEPFTVGTALKDDARLIRTELDRCQSILDGMSGRAGDGVPTALEPLAPVATTQLVKERLSETRRQRLLVEVAPDRPSPSATRAEMVHGNPAASTARFVKVKSGCSRNEFAKMPAQGEQKNQRPLHQ